MYGNCLLSLLLVFVLFASAAAQEPCPPGAACPKPAGAAEQADALAQACRPQSNVRAASIVSAIGNKGAALEHVPVFLREEFLPDTGPVDLLVFSKFAGGEKGKDDERIGYRVVVLDADEADKLLAPGANAVQSSSKTAPLNASIPPALIRSERATGGANGLDFKQDLPPDEKTLLHFQSDIHKTNPWWTTARVFVIGCTVPGGVPRFVGALDTKVTTTWLCAVFALLITASFYVIAAMGTYLVHKRQSKLDNQDELDENFPDDQYERGTNFFGKLRHMNPVVLSAGGDGRGSAGKLQILFFSLVVFGLVAFIWMRTGHLSGLSSNLLLLMGISGVAATASGGAKLAKSRIDFDNWAWLIHRKWMPRGGIAQLNPARIQDIVTNDGEFDVYRFQMITFSFLVGISLLAAGAQMSDLSSFAMPSEFLSILGISQAVYVLGSLVAPATIKDLNVQIKGLKEKETALRSAIDKVVPAYLAVHVVFSEDDTLKAAKAAHDEYVEAWEKTLVMYSSTLGKDVPEKVKRQRPPFPVPDALLEDGSLAPGTVGVKYRTDLLAFGGRAPYEWTLVNPFDAVVLADAGLRLDSSGVLYGVPTRRIEHVLAFSVTDKSNPPMSKLRKLRLKIDEPNPAVGKAQAKNDLR